MISHLFHIFVVLQLKSSVTKDISEPVLHLLKYEPRASLSFVADNILNCCCCFFLIFILKKKKHNILIGQV